MSSINQDKANQLHGELVQEWNKSDHADLNKVKTLLTLLKVSAVVMIEYGDCQLTNSAFTQIELSELSLLFPNVDDKSNLNVAGLTTARESCLLVLRG